MNYKRFTILIFTILGPVFLMAQSLVNEKVSDELIPLFEKNDKVNCIIQYSKKADLTQSAYLKTKSEKGRFVYNQLTEARNQSQKETWSYLELNHIDYNSYYVVNAISATLTMEDITYISQLDNVKKIAHNPTVRLEKYSQEQNTLTKNLPEPEWGIKKIQADSVWNLGFKGEGVVVGGQDTGFEWTHPSLISKYRGVNQDTVDHNYNWHDAIRAYSAQNNDTLNPCGLDTKEPCDDNNHGTHTMGTMVGSDSLNAIGVAPNAKWIACRNMERGIGQPSTYIECFEWFLAPTDLSNGMADPDLAPDVINNSWSCPADEGCNETNWALMEEAIVNLKAAGIVVIVSAGNEGRDGCGTIARAPAIFEPSFAVGATQINDTIAAFSSRGPVSIDSSFRLKPDVSAPGVEVRSAVRNGNYSSFSGTSMAGPHVVGAVALIINANPSLRGQVELIEDILITSAIEKTDTSICFQYDGQDIPNPVYGHGTINVLKAVELALEVTSIQDVELNDNITFDIFPNPAFDIVNIIQKDIRDAAYSISIFDLSGKLVLQEKGNPNIVRIDGLPNGMYYVRMNTQMGSSIKKLVVSR